MTMRFSKTAAAKALLCLLIVMNLSSLASSRFSQGKKFNNQKSTSFGAKDWIKDFRVQSSTATPTASPTFKPTSRLTHAPSPNPTESPTRSPTNKPTRKPTSRPTNSPTNSPTGAPTLTPTVGPTALPTVFPTTEPTSRPTTLKPTARPTVGPTKLPTTESPTGLPTVFPTTTFPTFVPTTSSPMATYLPTTGPTIGPTRTPTNQPSIGTTALPTTGSRDPTTDTPTNLPTVIPSDQPSSVPTFRPTTASPTEKNVTPAPTIDLADLDARMNAVLDEYNMRGASVSFFDKNQMTEPIVRGYGRTATSDTSPLVTQDTVFLIASLSKVFAGMAVMMLVEDGVIGSLDDDICQILPAEWDQSACRNPNFKSTPVTWRMLVTHRSSIRSSVPWLENFGGFNAVGYGPIGGYFGEGAGGSCPLDDVVGFYRDFLIDKPTETLVGNIQNVDWYELGEKNGGVWGDFEPGTETLYSDVATGYIAALVEHATGTPFSVFTKTRIFEPLQMDNTAWFREDLPSNTPEAMPVVYTGNEWEDVGHYCFIDYSSGQLRTSARDLSRFLESMLSYADAIVPREVGVDSISCQVRPVAGAGDLAINSLTECDNGALWFLTNNQLKDLAYPIEEPFLDYDWTNGGWHDGGEAGVMTHMLVLPEAGVYVTVLSNTDGNEESAVRQMLIELVNTIRGNFPLLPAVPTPEPIPPPVSPQTAVIAVEIFHDEYPEETSWLLKDSDGEILFRQDVNTILEPEQKVEIFVEVPSGREYTFVIRDEFGDGMCCGGGEGSFRISVCDTRVVSGGFFIYHDIATFEANGAC